MNGIMMFHQLMQARYRCRKLLKLSHKAFTVDKSMRKKIDGEKKAIGMMRKLNGSQFRQFKNGPFAINFITAGRLLDKEEDFSFGPLARFDHANANVGTFVKMHTHKNDEILSYMWKGEMTHDDSTGEIVKISDRKLMMMNSGVGFKHEESVPEKDVEMLQIFIRPEKADLDPNIQFFDRLTIEKGKWHLIGGPEGSEAPLIIRQNVFLYDLHLEANSRVDVPVKEGYTPLLYVMDGEIKLGKEPLQKRDVVTDLEDHLPEITAVTDATVVLFLVDMEAEATTKGLYSGIQK